ncbi:MAG: Abi family protein [Clostridia bacterium]|jgi:abortive infection bacteriophage resistance protein|nr:Abi family protein [Clostridia bacterium]
MKEYKSNEELIDYLSSKGVIISNKKDALEKIERYTYYSIVNTYKNIFKDKNGDYINNVSFDDIYAIFEFDNNLKNIVLKYCLEIETVIKSIMANQISKIYGIKEYLNISNWDNKINVEIRENLLKKINNEIEKDYNVHTAVTHYIDKYGFVPPYVLVKILTFGVASSYYGLLKQSDRQAIAKYFKISDKLLKQILKNLTTVRNVAAHSDRLYNYTSKFYISFKLIDENYIKSDNITNLYMVVRCMERLLTKEQYKILYNSIYEEIKKLNEKVKSIKITKITEIMGFPMNKK